MTVRAYPAYRESGVNWLGSIPDHWMVRPLRQFATLTGGGTPNRDTLHYWNGNIPWVSPKDMKSDLISKSEEYITEDGLTAGAASLVEDNSILMVVRSGILKHTIPVALNTLPVTLNQDMKAIRLAPTAGDPRFFLRLIQGFNQPFLDLWSKQGATVESLETAAIRATVVPCPPLIEQSAIAEFLDRETGKIDALVAEQERLIALLKEKRQAVISHGVTKGLNPNAPMRDSGILWLGKVPAHWTVMRLKFAVGLNDAGVQIGPFGGMLTDLPLQPTGFKLYGQQNIISGDFEAGDRWISESTFVSNPAYHVSPGDLLVTRKGSLGNCRIIPENVKSGWFDSDSIRIKMDSQSLYNRFLQLILHEASYIEKQIDETRRGAILSGINSEVISNLLLVVPCLETQTAIVDYLQEQHRSFYKLTMEVTRAITLLHERRAALISAAVTGKIDVRDTVSAPRHAA